MGWNKGRYLGFDEGWNISTAANPVASWVGVTSGLTSGNGTPTFTYGTVSIGSAANTRRVIVVGAMASTGLTVSQVTINGVVADLAQSGSGNSSSGGTLVWVASAVVPAGTTAAVVVTYSGSNFIASPLGVWTVNNDFLSNPIPTAASHHPTSANSATAGLVTASGGFTLMVAVSFGAGGAWTVSFSDDPITEVGRDNGNGRLWGYSNGTQARTANTSLSFSVSTNLHLALWNFR